MLNFYKNLLDFFNAYLNFITTLYCNIYDKHEVNLLFLFFMSVLEDKRA